MKLIVGLGNIGFEYAMNRHNLGFMVVEELAQRHDLNLRLKKDWQALVAKGQIGDEEVVLALPATMMNLSGRAVGNIMQFYKLQPDDVWIVHDELDLEFGLLRIRQGGGTAGHNGIKSITKTVGADTIRWRIGVGRPTGQMDAAAFVLQNFSPSEQDQLPQIIASVADKLEGALETGLDITSHNLAA